MKRLKSLYGMSHIFFLNFPVFTLAEIKKNSLPIRKNIVSNELNEVDLK